MHKTQAYAGEKVFAPDLSSYCQACVSLSRCETSAVMTQRSVEQHPGTHLVQGPGCDGDQAVAQSLGLHIEAAHNVAYLHLIQLVTPLTLLVHVTPDFTHRPAKDTALLSPRAHYSCCLRAAKPLTQAPSLHPVQFWTLATIMQLGCSQPTPAWAASTSSAACFIVKAQHSSYPEASPARQLTSSCRSRSQSSRCGQSHRPCGAPQRWLHTPGRPHSPG